MKYPPEMNDFADVAGQENNIIQAWINFTDVFESYIRKKGLVLHVS